MPRIPLSTSQKVRHADAAVHQQGTPGGSWGMEDGAALQRAGNDLGNAFRHLGNAMMEFDQRRQESEDRLAAAEYEAAWTAKEEELERRMRENPGQYREFGKWASESDLSWADQGRQYTDRMTEDYRKLFEANWTKHRKTAIHRRQVLTIEASVKSQRSRYEQLLQDHCNSGNYDAATGVLTEIRGLEVAPYSQDELDNMDRYILGMKDTGEIRSQIDAGDFAVVDRLKEKDEKGTYKNFPNLTPDKRAEWIRYAERQQEISRLESRRSYLADGLSSGKYQSKEDLDRLYKEGKISAEDYKFRFDFAEAMETKQKRSAAEAWRESVNSRIAEYNDTGKYPLSRKEAAARLKNGEITAEQYNDEIRIIEAISGKEEQQRQKEHREESESIRLDQESRLAEFHKTGEYPVTKELLDSLLEEEKITPEIYNSEMRLLSGVEQIRRNKVQAIRKEIEQKQKAADESNRQQRKQCSDTANELKARISLMPYPREHEQATFLAMIKSQVKQHFRQYPDLQEDVLSAVHKKLSGDPLDQSETGKMLKERVKQLCDTHSNEKKDKPVSYFADYKLQLIDAAREICLLPNLTTAERFEKLNRAADIAALHGIHNLFNAFTGKIQIDTVGKGFDSREDDEYTPADGIDMKNIIKTETIRLPDGRLREYWIMKDNYGNIILDKDNKPKRFYTDEYFAYTQSYYDRLRKTGR